jgi:hypothetical protein
MEGLKIWKGQSLTLHMHKEMFNFFLEKNPEKELLKARSS